MSVLFSSRNPKRPPDWRWLYADYLVRNDIEPSRFDHDHWVVKAARFRRRLEDCKGDEDFALLERKFPDLYWAWDVSRPADDSARTYTEADDLFRFNVEARLLTGADNEHIQERTGLSPNVIDAYEAVFYDVRSHLDNKAWIMHMVIGPQMHIGLKQVHNETLWKIFGYFGGRFVLDGMIETFSGQGHPRSASGTASFLSDSVRYDFKRLAVIAAKTFRLDTMSAPALLQMFVDLTRLERETGDAADTNESLDRGKKIFEALGRAWMIGSKAKDDLTVESNRFGVILNTHQSMMLQTAEGGERIRSMEIPKFPPPPTAELMIEAKS